MYNILDLGSVTLLMEPLTGYCTISDYNKQNSVTMFWALNDS